MNGIVAILGAESTGKTALAHALAARLECPWVPEHLREWCDHEGRTPRADEQAGIAAEQARRIEALAASNAVVVADTTPLMTAVYSDIVFGDRTLYGTALDWHSRHVAHTLVMGLDLPWQADGLQRDGPHVRLPVDRLLRDALASRALRYSVIYGRDDMRCEAALAAVREMRPVAGSDDDAGPRLRPRCLECLDPDCEQLLHRLRP